MFVYTDGACSGNGYKNAEAGIGVYIPDLNIRLSRNITKESPPATNNRAEVYAAIVALDLVPCDATTEITIVSDSKYFVLGITQWIGKWVTNGWKTAAGKPVENTDLWRCILAKIQGRKISFQLVKGHARDEGNIVADYLAVEGSHAASLAGKVRIVMKLPGEGSV